jgi:hypothetical protein
METTFGSVVHYLVTGFGVEDLLHNLPQALQILIQHPRPLRQHQQIPLSERSVQTPLANVKMRLPLLQKYLQHLPLDKKLSLTVGNVEKKLQIA